MRIALVHDYLKEFGGAEKVLETLSDLYPFADIYTSLYLPSFFGPHQKRLTDKWQGRVHTSFFQIIPFSSKLISLLRVVSPLAFMQFDFSKYDLIITSATGAYFPNALRKKSAKLICYCHTPPRYLYGYPTARQITNPFLVFLSTYANHILRLLDFTFAQKVDQFIANSQTVSARIQKFYRRTSIVINPPIATGPFAYSYNSYNSSHYFLTGGRLAQAKRFDLAVQVAIKLKLKLKVFGRDFAGHEIYLKSLAQNHPNIEFLGEVSDAEKFQLLCNAQGFINPGKDEDFGMLNVEALACGCPVIAHNSGGSAETIISGKTGVLFDDLTVSGLTTAIKKFQKLKISKQACLTRAQAYSPLSFQTKIADLISTVLPQDNSYRSRKKSFPKSSPGQKNSH